MATTEEAQLGLSSIAAEEAGNLEDRSKSLSAVPIAGSFLSAKPEEEASEISTETPSISNIQVQLQSAKTPISTGTALHF